MREYLKKAAPRAPESDEAVRAVVAEILDAARLAENRRRAQPAYGGGGMMIRRDALVAALALGVLTVPLAAVDATDHAAGTTPHFARSER